MVPVAVAASQVVQENASKTSRLLLLVVVVVVVVALFVLNSKPGSPGDATGNRSVIIHHRLL